MSAPLRAAMRADESTESPGWSWRGRAHSRGRVRHRRRPLARRAVRERRRTARLTLRGVGERPFECGSGERVVHVRWRAGNDRAAARGGDQTLDESRELRFDVARASALDPVEPDEEVKVPAAPNAGVEKERDPCDAGEACDVVLAVPTRGADTARVPKSMQEWTRVSKFYIKDRLPYRGM